MSNQGGRPPSTEASRFPHLQTIAHGPPGSSKNYRVHRHKAAWLVAQLTKLPKTHGNPSRKARSRPKVVGFSNLNHTPGVSPIARLPLPKNGGHRSPIFAFVPMPWAVLAELVFRFGVNRVNLLLRPSSSRFPRKRLDSASRPSLRGSQNGENCLRRLRPIGIMKMPSFVESNRRPLELTLLGADPVSLCFSHQRGKS